MPIYEGQTAIKITFTNLGALNDVQSIEIKCKTPEGIILLWTPTITDITKGIVEYNFKNTDILSVGVHVAWVVFTLSDNRIGKSDPKQFTVVEEGKIII